MAKLQKMGANEALNVDVSPVWDSQTAVTTINKYTSRITIDKNTNHKIAVTATNPIIRIPTIPLITSPTIPIIRIPTIPIIRIPIMPIIRIPIIPIIPIIRARKTADGRTHGRTDARTDIFVLYKGV